MSDLLLPTGSQVVTRAAALGSSGQTLAPRGAVGVIIVTPADHTKPYRVRFPDAAEAELYRQEIALRKHVQSAGLRGANAPGDAFDVTACVIYRCVIGSRAYGLETDSSDADRRGIYLPPADLQWSLEWAPEQVENDATQREGTSSGRGRGLSHTRVRAPAPGATRGV